MAALVGGGPTAERLSRVAGHLLGSAAGPSLTAEEVQRSALVIKKPTPQNISTLIVAEPVELGALNEWSWVLLNELSWVR